MPDDAVVMEIFSLSRRNAEQRAKIESLNLQISKALEVLQSMKRFLSLWVLDGQGETYDQLKARMHGIDAAIVYLENRMIGPDPSLEIPAVWRKGQDR